MLSGQLQVYSVVSNPRFSFSNISYSSDISSYVMGLYSATPPQSPEVFSQNTWLYPSTSNTNPYIMYCIRFNKNSSVPKYLRGAYIPIVTFLNYSNTGEYILSISTNDGIKTYRYNDTSGILISSFVNVETGESISTDSSSPTTFTLAVPATSESVYQITIEDAGNLDMVEFGDPGLRVSEFPYTTNVSSNQTWYFTGKQSSYTVTAQNTQNMKQIQVGSTVYNTFPASIPITANTTLQCSGEDDKTITVNYTNTSVPVITDTQ